MRGGVFCVCGPRNALSPTHANEKASKSRRPQLKSMQPGGSLDCIIPFNMRLTTYDKRERRS
ncbi:unnamed protein product [Nesidiocoris tenuis]|uniref:Uncharacterized protein n=1 Tax=Nesidiocoris tenuis TaxID=355587 RepID=A0A6H5H7E4_9HEMI|nr:unnamed protein product [Nesidiocoris tenuis]